MTHSTSEFRFPGSITAVDGNTAVAMCEREGSDAAGAYPITPSTQMGEYWAEAAAAGHLNISGRPLIFIEPEGEHAAAAVTAGLAMTGLRASNFSSGQGIAYMHESLYAAVGKRLTYVLNIGARAMTKATLNVHAGHDDYHCMDDTGFFQMFAKDAQSVADLNLIAHRTAELALTPGVIAQDGFLTTHLIESIRVPQRELVEEFLGRPDDIIATPTPAQRIIYGDSRRRIPELWDVDNPMMAGTVQNQDSYMQSVAAQRPYFFDHIVPLAQQSFDEFHRLTGRQYQRVMAYRVEDADYLILGQGSMIPTAEVVADYLRESRGIKVGVVNLVMFRPFPTDIIGRLLRGKQGVAVLERLDQPLAVDLPLMREVRATVSRCLENGRDPDHPAFADLETYRSITDAPPLYSGSFGMGSRDLQPEGIVAAVENMLPDAPRRKFFYLSIDFLRDDPVSPKQRIHQEQIEDSYPHIRDLAIRGSENPNLMPAGSVTVRLHSVGGWGAITTGKNLAMTLFNLLDYHIKANPKYGSEKKGQPTTYYLSAAPEPIRVNSEYFYVDVVLSPDPNVFEHTNALAGLKDEGVFIIQSDKPSAAEVWRQIPEPYRRIIVDRNIQLFYLDAFKIAREEASDPDLQLRMQGNAFQGAFFAATPVAKNAGLSDQRLLQAIQAQLQHKFGGKGARVVEENVSVVKRGFDEVKPVPHGEIDVSSSGTNGQPSEPALPVMLKTQPQSETPRSDIHRFWEQTGSFYARGMGGETTADPFVGLGTVPAVTTLFRDMTGIRFQHPQWVSENCTACGNCYTVCPDTAIPGLVSEVTDIFDTVVGRVRKREPELKQLPKAVRQVERNLRTILSDASENENVRGMLDEAITNTIRRSDLNDDDKDRLKHELGLFRDELGDFQFALSRPYFTLIEKEAAGEGGLLSITINPYTCKGCMECVQVCDDDALRPVTQTKESIESLRHNWDFWQDLPTTPAKYSRVQDIEQGIGALETILLDKRNYTSLASGDGACLGCGEKSIVHLFSATVEALMQPRIEHHVARLTDLIDRLQQHIQQKIVHEIDVGDPATIARIVDSDGGKDLTLAGIAESVEQQQGGEPIDRRWLRHVTDLLAQLKSLKWKYVKGTTGRGRASAGILNATGCSSVWGSTYPYNPYPFPWANHLFQDAASMAMGVFEGHMAKMADGFKAIRLAEAELAAGPNDAEELDLTYFNWRHFTDEEWELCPPVVALGGDGAMYDIGFQNLSRLMMSGKPVKVLVLDTQVYSNTGGQACTSGFMGQVSDMAQFGKAIQGKEEIRKEMALIAMAHRTTYVLQSTIAQPNHLIEGFIEGLKTRRPALFNLYTPCQPEHGIGDDMSANQARLAVESRAYPLFRYNPDHGDTLEQCIELDGNPAMDQPWPTYTLNYVENGRQKAMDLPMTFADFAATETRFRKHFRVAPPDTWNDKMIPLADFLERDDEEREDRYPYVWSVDRNRQLMRLLVAKPIVDSCEDRRDYWKMLRSLAGVDQQPLDRGKIESEIRQEISTRIASKIAQLVTGEEPATTAAVVPKASSDSPAGGNGAASAGSSVAPSDAASDFLAPWIDTPQCTSCDECVRLNPNLFVYNDQKKATIKDPQGGPYKDLVKAAERCTAQVIHPGLPKDRSEKDIDKWIARAKKYNQ